ncbi:MAG: methylenetetrahydrofolate reductase [Spirochaetaceae bacterium]|nr:methylenetetrahydrofolate reductase [Spirochaetaceae bacterium]
MGVLESLSAGRRVSIEVVPPSRGGDIEAIKGAVGLLMPHDPAFVSVTDHPAGRAWAESSDGPSRVALRTKPGTLGTAVAIRDAFRVQTVPHLVCGTADRLAMEDLLIDLHYAGFADLFVVRGDDRFSPAALRPGATVASRAADSYAYAIDLVAHIAALNAGRYTPPAEGRPTSFRVGVAGYPQKHYAAPNLETDIARLAEKVRAGASYIVTQMVFEAGAYKELLKRLREGGIDVPVIPGIKPLLRASAVDSIPRTFFVDLPQALVSALNEARSPAEERAAGIAWATKLAGDLTDAGAPCLHFFTMGSGAATKAVLDAFFGTKGKQ